MEWQNRLISAHVASHSVYQRRNVSADWVKGSLFHVEVLDGR